jgi:hypothetical protein
MLAKALFRQATTLTSGRFVSASATRGGVARLMGKQMMCMNAYRGFAASTASVEKSI